MISSEDVPPDPPPAATPDALQAKRFVLEQIKGEYDHEMKQISNAPANAAASSNLFIANAALMLFVATTLAQAPEAFAALRWGVALFSGVVFLVATALFMQAHLGRTTQRLEDPLLQLKNYRDIVDWAQEAPGASIEDEMLDRYLHYYSSVASFNRKANFSAARVRILAVRLLGISMLVNLLLVAEPSVRTALQASGLAPP